MISSLIALVRFRFGIDEKETSVKCRGPRCQRRGLPSGQEIAVFVHNNGVVSEWKPEHAELQSIEQALLSHSPRQELTV
jgi:hypothetical protein